MFQLTKRLLVTGAILLGAATAFAQDSGPLIELLLKKGIIDDNEAEDLRAELVKDFVSNTPAGKLNLGSTVKGFRLAGDLRVRYQYDNEVQTFAPASVGANNDRSRYRYRFRFGPTVTFSNNWSAGFRLETANGATSTNDDFGATGSTVFAKDGNTAYVGQAWIQYATSNWFGIDRADFRIGKHAHTFFTPGVNGFWIDSDINFEGLSEELGFNDVLGAKGWTLALRGGQYLLAANSRTAEKAAGSFLNSPSVMYVGQAELSSLRIVEGNAYGARIAPTFVMFSAPEVTGFVVNSEANNYDNLATFLLPVEYTLKAAGKPLSLYATYGLNFEGASRANRLYSTSTSAVVFGTASGNPKDNDTMYNVGFRYGVLRNPGDWQLTGEYRSVESGAYSALLLDSDFNGGRLNGKGFIFSFAYNWTDAIGSTVTYFNSKAIDKKGPAALGFATADVLQIDLTAKF